MIKFTPHQQKVYDAFDSKDTDIDIAVLYTRVYGDPGHLKAREMQQKLAPSFARINDLLWDIRKKTYYRIEPGIAKRTYRLSKKG